MRWDFVFQRPQHLLSRLAQTYRVVFVEEPIFKEGEHRLDFSSPAPGVTVCKPYTSIQAPGFHDDQLPVLQRLTAELVPDGEKPIVWFYTPMALPLLQQFDPSLVVYDCMDELSAFANAPRQLLQREAALLNIADLVFTGGPSLYEAKRTRTAHAHCFASSVDVGHFGQALQRDQSHPLQAAIAHPRLGYYGVIDERLDLALIGALADAHPDWQIVLVGPVVKIDPATLPQRPNLHYLGQQPYAALPSFLAGWDVCLMPFALNASTRFISPTKVLEYMAAELPIVSTAIADVVKPYGGVVSIGRDAPDFIAKCEAALAQDAAASETMRAQMREIVGQTSWDRTAQQMVTLMQNTVPGQHSNRHLAAASSSNAAFASTGTVEPSGPVAHRVERRVNPLRGATRTSTTSCLIVGAGPTGLSAAYHYGPNAVLLEKNQRVGGWCRSVQDQGFTFDYAGHIMFSNDPYVLKLYDKLLGDNIHWQNREAWVYSKNVFTRYPFQGALYGLPPAVIKECIVGAIESRYGSATPAADTRSAANCDSKTPEDCCADGAVDLAGATAAAAASAAPAKPANFQEFIYKVWGAGIAKHFAIPYNKKLWTVPLTEMETSWLGGRVPLPDLGEIIEGALEPVGKPMGPNARFGYPLKGGFEALVAGFLPHIAGKVETNAQVARISPSEHTVALIDGRRFVYDHLISTMPLPELVKMIGDEAPEEVRAAARGLRHLSVRCVNLGIGRPDVTDKHWIYYPEETIFHRIFVQGNASPHCNPPGGFGLTCEISYSPTKPLPVDGEALIARCVADLIEVGLLTAQDKILTANLVDMPYAYVVYDHARAHNVETVKAWLAQHDIVLSGRYSEWEYYNSDHAFVAGKKAAETVHALQLAKVGRTPARLAGK
ncbi:MAG: FAD-dependent oxidoreductase [Pseudomonadota bacterium]|nr:FAD-dependent oxidoreductase [Pseudomonadota bacterium]